MSNVLTTAAQEPTRSARVYHASVIKNFAFLKQTARLDDLFAKSIVLPDDRGFLLPVCELHAQDEELIARFARWREDNTFAFPTQFPVTLEGTRNWLRSRVLGVEDRVLFLVVDKVGHQIGHLGYANALNDALEMEIDNVVRGVQEAAPGIMSAAMLALINWGEEVIGAASIHLRVFSDNDHAVAFYRQLGFQDEELIPLRRHEKGSTISFDALIDRDSAPPDRFFLKMRYAPQRTAVGVELILTAGPSISAREASYALDAAQRGWNNEWNKYIRRFETTFADYVGAKYALSTSSCTGALHLALAALGIGPGDEVIVPDITWVATANAVVYVGATPIFADIDPQTWCLDPKSMEEAITSRTRAIIPVHLYGHPAEMDRIMAIAQAHDLFVVEDAAPAIGAEFRGQKTGTFGHLAAFSFQGAKLAVTGEGGILVTSDETLYEKAYALWDQGRTPGTFWINEVGWKYKMSNIQAALGLGQIERIDELIEAKRRIFGWYVEGLAGVPHITLNHEAPWARSIYWMTSILLDEDASLGRDELRVYLRQRNVDTRPVFPAISQYPIWPRPQIPQPTARRVGDQAINLPSGVCLKRDKIAYVCTCIRDAFGQ